MTSYGQPSLSLAQLARYWAAWLLGGGSVYPWWLRLDDWAVVLLVTHRRPSRVDAAERECITHARDAHYTAAAGGSHCVGCWDVLDFPAVRFGGVGWDAETVEELVALLRAEYRGGQGDQLRAGALLREAHRRRAA